MTDVRDQLKRARALLRQWVRRCDGGGKLQADTCALLSEKIPSATPPPSAPATTGSAWRTPERERCIAILDDHKQRCGITCRKRISEGRGCIANAIDEIREMAPPLSAPPPSAPGAMQHRSMRDIPGEAAIRAVEIAESIASAPGGSATGSVWRTEAPTVEEVRAKFEALRRGHSTACVTAREKVDGSARHDYVPRCDAGEHNAALDAALGSLDSLIESLPPSSAPPGSAPKPCHICKSTPGHPTEAAPFCSAGCGRGVHDCRDGQHSESCYREWKRTGKPFACLSREATAPATVRGRTGRVSWIGGGYMLIKFDDGRSVIEWHADGIAEGDEVREAALLTREQAIEACARAASIAGTWGRWSWQVVSDFLCGTTDGAAFLPREREALLAEARRHPALANERAVLAGGGEV